MRSLPLFRKFIAQQYSLQASCGKVLKLFRADMHYKCRNDLYPGSNVKRYIVPDDKVPWKEKYPEYDPPIYTSPSVSGRPWADPDIGAVGFSPQWNCDNGEINRSCGDLKYEIDTEGYPINPVGRTGIRGRGLLGRWGSNCAGDCIVTRWKRDNITRDIIRDGSTGKGLLEFIAIKRNDCGEWAIPGGFADRSEEFMHTIKREFFEEALNNKIGFVDTGNIVNAGNLSNNNEFARQKLDELFKKGRVVYSGYVDDRRNTDQAWISTNAVNVHDDSGDILNAIQLEAGDDAVDTIWMDVNNNMRLYANHKDFLRAAAELLGAYF